VAIRTSESSHLVGPDKSSRSRPERRVPHVSLGPFFGLRNTPPPGDFRQVSVDDNPGVATSSASGNGGQRAFDVRQQYLATGGEPNPTCRTLEQRPADLSLEQSHTRRDRRLRQAGDCESVE